MANPSKFGTCHICMEQKKLTLEHVPPRRAYNKHFIVAHTLSTVLARQTNVPIGTAMKFRAGMGVKTLCGDCNEKTAHYYGEAFAEWAAQALDYATKYDEDHAADNYLHLPFTIEPLAVLKQIVTMLLAVSDPSGREEYRAMRRFVRVPFEQGLPPTLNIRTYLNPKKAKWVEPQNRMVGKSVTYNVNTKAFVHTVADIAFPPLGYWATILSHDHWQLREYLDLADMSHFAKFPWRRRRTVYLSMPVRCPVGAFRFDGHCEN
jgi:hypothetical protein